MPVATFAVPEGVVFAKVDPATGLLARAEEKETVFMPFIEGTEPTAYSRPRAEARDLFRMDLPR
jgi:penicillin-binding protein 1A